LEEDKTDEEKKPELEARIVELEESWKRALADYKNLERRVSEEREMFIKLANLSLILRFLEIYDSLKLAEVHDKTIAGPILKQIQDLLDAEGVKVLIVDRGDIFDPEKMEVLEGSKGEKVEKVVRDGFELEGSIIRPARVELGNGKS
jgi:molecular chaperone GrpE